MRVCVCVCVYTLTLPTLPLSDGGTALGTTSAFEKFAKASVSTLLVDLSISMRQGVPRVPLASVSPCMYTEATDADPHLPGLPNARGQPVFKTCNVVTCKQGRCVVSARTREASHDLSMHKWAPQSKQRRHRKNEMLMISLLLDSHAVRVYDGLHP